MTRTKIISGLTAILLSASIYAQKDQKDTDRLADLSKKLEGTYQVQLIQMRQEIAFPLTVLDDIEARRHATDTVYYQLQDKIQVVILPKNLIAQPFYKKLSPAIIHKN